MENRNFGTIVSSILKDVYTISQIGSPRQIAEAKSEIDRLIISLTNIIYHKHD